jgi:hypothetical protein
MTAGSRASPADFIVVVPGYLGSKLRKRAAGETFGVDFRSIPKNPVRWGEWLDELLASPMLGDRRRSVVRRLE